MEGTVTPSLETVVDQILDGMDEPLETIRALTSKTDADFIVEGRFNPSLRAANNEAISKAIDRYNKSLKDKQPAAITQEAGLPPETRVAVTYVCQKSLVLPTWNHRAVGSRYETPIPKLPGSVEDVRPMFSRTAAQVDEAVAWWRNEAPFFAQFDEGITTASIYPARGHDNVQVSEGEHSYSIDSSGTIFVAFENGQKVTVNNNGKEISGIRVDDGPSKFGQPLLGSYMGTYGEPGDFGGGLYSRIGFVDRDGSINGVTPTDAQKYAARVALQVLREQITDNTLPDVQLALPREKFRTDVVEFLARSTVQAFLEPKLTAEVVESHGMMSGYQVEGVNLHETPNQIRVITEARLRAFLGAAGCTILEYSEAVRQELAGMRRGSTLGGRIDAIRVEPHVEALLDTFSS